MLPHQGLAWHSNLTPNYKWSQIQFKPKCYSGYRSGKLTTYHLTTKCPYFDLLSLLWFKQVASQAGEASQNVNEASPLLHRSMTSLFMN